MVLLRPPPDDLLALLSHCRQFRGGVCCRCASTSTRQRPVCSHRWAEMGCAEGPQSLLHVCESRPCDQGKRMTSLLSPHCIEGFSSLALLKIIQVINKTLAFHTSVNYEFKAPQPFTADVHEDLLGDLARIEKQSYRSDYDLHIDFSRTLKRLNDGHCVWINSCYVRIAAKISHHLRADVKFIHRMVCRLLLLPI